MEVSLCVAKRCVAVSWKHSAATFRAEWDTKSSHQSVVQVLHTEVVLHTVVFFGGGQFEDPPLLIFVCVLLVY